jgi:hypothetical protein
MDFKERKARNYCAGEDQQQFNSTTDLPISDFPRLLPLYSLGSGRIENTFSNNSFVVADVLTYHCPATAHLVIEPFQRSGQCLSCHVAIIFLSLQDSHFL